MSFGFFSGFILGVVALGAAAYYYDKYFNVMEEYARTFLKTTPSDVTETTPEPTVDDGRVYLKANRYRFYIKSLRAQHGSLTRYEKDIRHRMSKYRLRFVPLTDDRVEFTLMEVHGGERVDTMTSLILDGKIEGDNIDLSFDFREWQFVEYPYYLTIMLMEKFGKKLEESEV